MNRIIRYAGPGADPDRDALVEAIGRYNRAKVELSRADAEAANADAPSERIDSAIRRFGRADRRLAALIRRAVGSAAVAWRPPCTAVAATSPRRPTTSANPSNSRSTSAGR